MGLQVPTTVQNAQRQKFGCPKGSEAKDILRHHWGEPITRLIFSPVKDTLKYQFVSHVGYVSFFPLFLRTLPADSPKLGRLLKKLQDPKHIWSKFGLRSL